MKRRVFCLLLSLCLIAGLFAAMGATAYADGDTISYTLQSGDTVAYVCAKLGIDFHANQEWIMKTNNISDFTKLGIGRVLTLPAPGKVLRYVATTAPAATTTPAATATAATSTTSTTSVPTVTYTMQAGDNVSTICNRLGINFAANEAWIRAANNISNYNNMRVGTTLILPAPGTTPALSTATAGTAAAAAPAATTATSLSASTASAASAGLLSGDTVSYYLITYVVKSGDTLFNICRSFGAVMDTVQSINGIANAARLNVGQNLLIPSNTAPTSGSFIKVVAHKIVSGDTVLGICNSYKISYEANANTIKKLNNRDNLNAIQVGKTLLIPVPATAAVAAASTSTPAAATTPTTTTTPTTGKYYTLNPTGSANGTYSLTVNGQSVNSANAGTTVHIVVTPDHGFKLAGILVVNSTNNASVTVDANNNFVMPEGNVRISVSFTVDAAAQPHYVYNASVTQQNVIAVVNGANKTSVEPGETVSVQVSSMPAGYAVQKIVVTTINPSSIDQVKNNTIDSSKVVAVGANNSFTMPSADVFVTVLLQQLG